MTWVVWRQHHNQLYRAAAALAVFAVLLLTTGRQMASQDRSALTSCSASHNCGNFANTLTSGNPLLSLLVTLTVVVPCLLGVFWGGPLVVRELETGTILRVLREPLRTPLRGGQGQGTYRRRPNVARSAAASEWRQQQSIGWWSR